MMTETQTVPGPPEDDEASAIDDAIQAEEDARRDRLEAERQARLWMRQRSLRAESAAEVLRVLLAALGFPTLGASEFSSFDPDAVDGPVAEAIRLAVKALLADLQATAAPAPGPGLRHPS